MGPVGVPYWGLCTDLEGLKSDTFVEQWRVRQDGGG